jgi:hypothetical protein
MGNLSREQILARKTGRATVDLGDGDTVSIRALTLDEVLTSQDIDNNVDKVCFVVATALVDPVLSLAEVHEWAKQGDAGDLQVVSDEIAILSRVATRSTKSAGGKTGVARPRKRS